MAQKGQRMTAWSDTELNEMRQWDEDLYAHVFVTRDEYHHDMVVATDGDFVDLASGERLVDFTSGLLCVNAGNKNPTIRDAVVKAMDEIGFAWEGFANPYRTRAAKLILQDLLGPDDWAGRVRFTSSGSEAVELALLVAKTVTGKPNIISRDFAYHGWTLGALSVQGLPGTRGVLASPDGEIRRPPGVPVAGTHFAPAPYCRRCPIGHTYPACKSSGTLACISSTEHMIKTLGADTVAAVIAEPIFGVGMIHPPKEYLGQLRELTRDYGILWIDDEVMTGFGRTGKWFGYQHSPGVTPDLMTIGKGVVSAALPVGGLVMSREITKFMDDFRWETVSTFAGHPITMAAVEANVRWLIDEKMADRAAATGERFGQRLAWLADRHPSVAEIAGAGMLWAMELVRPDGSGQPFVAADRHAIPNGQGITPSIFVAATARRLGMQLATAPPNTLRIGPSLSVADDTIELGISILDNVLTALDQWDGVSPPS
jgi:taurine---2-oxoglutarate transaminase